MNRPGYSIATGNWMAGLAVVLLAVSIARPCQGQTAGTNSPPATNSVPAYRFIAQRNIFNPNRYSNRPGENRAPPPNAPGFSLVGTMTYEKGTFAFFDGNDSQYKKVLQASGTIADYRVAEIGPKHVKLEVNGNPAGTNSITLPVGMQMKKIGDGEWQLVAGESYSGGGGGGGGGDGRWGDRRNRNRSDNNNSSSSGSSSQPAPAPSSGTSSSGGGGSADDILRRLMQQREREIQR